MKAYTYKGPLREGDLHYVLEHGGVTVKVLWLVLDPVRIFVPEDGELVGQSAQAPIHELEREHGVEQPHIRDLDAEIHRSSDS